MLGNDVTMTSLVCVRYFPKIFGPQENEPLNSVATMAAFEKLTEEVCSPPRHHLSHLHHLTSSPPHTFIVYLTPSQPHHLTRLLTTSHPRTLTTSHPHILTTSHPHPLPPSSLPPHTLTASPPHTYLYHFTPSHPHTYPHPLTGERLPPRAGRPFPLSLEHLRRCHGLPQGCQRGHVSTNQSPHTGHMTGT